MLELVLRWVAKRRGDLQSETQAVELLRRVRLELVDPVFLQKARRKNPVGETTRRLNMPLCLSCDPNPNPPIFCLIIMYVEHTGFATRL